MSDLPKEERWDCGGNCIFGEQPGEDRDCDECWANCMITAPEHDESRVEPNPTL